jgi:2-oxoglutarate dehydrogenase E2 component (dihydrolipoamide succinyltransferase)
MKQNVEVPQVGESVTTGILAAWFRKTGEMVTEGEELFELETDKATMPVPAPITGVLTIITAEDTEVEIGTVVAEIDTEATAEATDSDEGNTTGSRTGTAADAAGSEIDTTVSSGVTPAPSLNQEALSPAVRRALEEHGLDAATVAEAVTASGKDGRLTKADVEGYLRQQAAAPVTPRAAPLPTSPSASPAGSPAAGSESPATRGSEAAAGTQERRKMSPLRRRIAENLVRSRRESAHLTTFNEVDMSAVMNIRTTYKERFEERHGVRLGFMSFFIKAAQRALQEFPGVNSFVDGEEIVYNNYYNIGVAISTDRGLIVPVLRNVESLGFAAIEETILDFAKRAGEKKIMPDEFSGGTFTITNGGVFGSMLSTPIPSPPQTAVLGMHSIQKRAVVVDDEIVIRPMMYLAITYDHRVIDGREAIGFLNRIKGRIEDPTQLLLEL